MPMSASNTLYWGVFLLMLLGWDQFFWGHDGVIKDFIVNSLHKDSPIFLFLASHVYRIAIGITGSLAIVGMFCNISAPRQNTCFLVKCSSWGQYTMGIYILQSILWEDFNLNVYTLDNMNPFVFNFIAAPIISFLILAICVGVIRLMSRSPNMRFLFFGKTKPIVTDAMHQ